MPAIDAVIFDLDDTLYPERAYAFSGFAAVAQAFASVLGDPAVAATRMRELFDTEHRRRVFNTVLAEKRYERDEQLVARMIETYRTHRPAIALHPDADAALTRVHGQYKLGLITDGPAVMQWNKIDALQLRPRFDEIMVTDELGEGCGKPSPRAIELMSERLSVHPTRCAYVADNPAKDFIAPNALGWTTIQITRPDGIYQNESPPEGGEPDHLIDTLYVLDGLLT